MAGFTFRYRLSGGAPTIQKIKAATTATLTKGDMLNLEAGEADLAVTTDAELLGVFLGPTGAKVDGVTDLDVITDEDAVYGCDDANARVAGALLDVGGATGAQHLDAAAGNEFLVVAPSSATEETLVTFNVAHSWLT
jgi:CobQ-like glutamine amidotransferase family enzyme